MVAKSIRPFQRGVQLARSNECLGKWLCLEFRSSPGENLAFVSSQISRIAEEVLTFSFSGRYIHVQFHVVCCKKERCIVRVLIRQFYPPRSIHCFYVFFRQSEIPFTFFYFHFFCLLTRAHLYFMAVSVTYTDLISSRVVGGIR